MAAIDTWTTRLTAERDAALAAVQDALAQEDATGAATARLITNTEIQKLALAQAALDAITAAAG